MATQKRIKVTITHAQQRQGVVSFVNAPTDEPEALDDVRPTRERKHGHPRLNRRDLEALGMYA